MQGKEYVNFLLEEKDKIAEFVAGISSEMQEYIANKKESKFVLFYKKIHFGRKMILKEVPTFG